MKKVEGDLLLMAHQGKFDAIVHGCNCFCVMGAGIARAIANTFPRAFIADQETERGLKEKLGTCTSAECPIPDGTVLVINAYTQYSMGGPRSVDYDAVRSCMKWIKENHSGKRIGLPKIGAGLGGGNWSVISKIIDEELTGEDVTLVILP